MFIWLPMLHLQANGSPDDSTLICRGPVARVDRAAEPTGIQQPAQRMLLHVCHRDVLIWNLSGLGYSLHLHWHNGDFLPRSLERPYKVYSSCWVMLTQRPPKYISYQKDNFKAEEKTESKHLKAQMEANNYTQCSRKCHFTICEVCGGDDINTHSRISLLVLLRSSWEAHSSAPRCLLKSPVFLCTSLTTTLCGSLIALRIAKSELLAMLPKAGCKITPSPLS